MTDGPQYSGPYQQTQAPSASGHQAPFPDNSQFSQTLPYNADGYPADPPPPYGSHDFGNNSTSLNPTSGNMYYQNTLPVHPPTTQGSDFSGYDVYDDPSNLFSPSNPGYRPAGPIAFNNHAPPKISKYDEHLYAPSFRGTQRRSESP